MLAYRLSLNRVPIALVMCDGCTGKICQSVYVQSNGKWKGVALTHYPSISIHAVGLIKTGDKRDKMVGVGLVKDVGMFIRGSSETGSGGSAHSWWSIQDISACCT